MLGPRHPAPLRTHDDAPARALGLAALLTAAALAPSCTSPPPFAPTGRDAGPPAVCADLGGATVRCLGDVAYACDGASDFATSTTDCAGAGQTCAPGLGCRVCPPLSVRCDGETIETCDAAGSAWLRGETCDAAAGLRCSREGCLDLCAEAARTDSYLGCEYWPVTLLNQGLDDGFSVALALANPGLVPARVTVEGNGSAPRTLTLAPGALEVVELAWNETLRGRTGPSASALVRGGAYHVTSDVPITASQFNPLRFQAESGCVDRSCFSFSNDASLLLPAHVLTGSYVVASRATHVLSIDGMDATLPGFVTIVGTAATRTPVTVRARAATLAAAPDATEPLRALAPGESATFELGPGDVLQLLSALPEGCPGTAREETYAGRALAYCDPGEAYDLTGTEVRANAPVAVYSGHSCTFVPFDRWACDHLEEQLFPVESLGRDLFVTTTRPLRRGEPNLLRVISAADGNEVRFEPPLAAAPEPLTLNRGEWREFVVTEPVWVRGTGPLLGALYLVGQDYAGVGTAGSVAVGDPALALVVPNAQFRDRYTLLAPDTYTEHWLDVAAVPGTLVAVDGAPLRGLTDVPGTGMQVAHVELASGVHEITGSGPFGVYLSGFGRYTSYYLPGGMDFTPIAPPF